MERVGFHLRVAAFLIDFAVVALGVHAALALDFYLNDRQGMGNFGVVTAAGAWLAIACVGLTEALASTSPGKKMLGLTIGGEEGRRPPRRALLTRAALKYAPLLFALLPMVMYGVNNGTGSWRFSSYVRDGMQAVFIIDTVCASSILLYVIVGCFRVLRPDRQAFHDLLAHTAVFRRAELLRGRGFDLLFSNPGGAAEPAGNGPPIPVHPVAAPAPASDAPR